MESAKEEIRARLAVEDVIGQYIELKRAGRNFKGHSPWGTDRTPSFMVSPEKGIWYDFSSNKGGDIFTFVMEMEGCTFREALEKLASQAGVELKRYLNHGSYGMRLGVKHAIAGADPEFRFGIFLPHDPESLPEQFRMQFQHILVI